MTTASPVGTVSAGGATRVETQTRRGPRAPLPGHRRRTPLFFCAPYLLITAVFFIYPLLYATRLAFFQTAGPDLKQFVGLANFRWVLADPEFHTALWNTSVFAVFSIFLQLPLS